MSEEFVPERFFERENVMYAGSGYIASSSMKSGVRVIISWGESCGEVAGDKTGFGAI